MASDVRWWAGSGGGSAGSAWHAGYLRRRAEAGVQYAGAAGVSAGAFAAAAVAMFHDLTDAAAMFHTLALGVRTSDLLRRHFPLGRVHALWDSAAMNSDPTIELLKRHLDARAVAASGKQLRIGISALTQPPGEAADVEEGAPGAVAYFTVDETYVPLWEAVYASSANPGIFRPRLVRGRWCVDGGIQVVTPLRAAIDAGATHVDLSIANTPHPRPMVREATQELSTVDVLLRSLELAIHRLTWVDLRYTQRINSLVEAGHADAEGMRYIHLNVSHPDSPLNDDPMAFVPEEATAIALRGYGAALALEADAE